MRTSAKDSGRQLRLRPLVVIAVVILGIALPASVNGANAVRPSRISAMPGEKPLTRAQMDHALSGMGPEERASRSRRWSDPSFLPTSYSRAYFKIEKAANGTSSAKLVAAYSTDATVSALTATALDSRIVAAGTGSGGRYDLYLSIATARRSCSGCYEFYIDNWADWQGTYGMDQYNLAEESYGTSWAGNMYLYRDSMSGAYDRAGDGTIFPADIYRSDATPNEGVGWSFHEWKRPCGQCTGLGLNWADGTAIIRESYWHYATDNVANKYLHSKATGSSYSLTFYNAGITISPVDSNQWTAACFATLTH
jgi:hypothetical protein